MKYNIVKLQVRIEMSKVKANWYSFGKCFDHFFFIIVSMLHVLLYFTIHWLLMCLSFYSF